MDHQVHEMAGINFQRECQEYVWVSLTFLSHASDVASLIYLQSWKRILCVYRYVTRNVLMCVFLCDGGSYFTGVGDGYSSSLWVEMGYPLREATSYMKNRGKWVSLSITGSQRLESLLQVIISSQLLWLESLKVREYKWNFMGKCEECRWQFTSKALLCESWRKQIMVTGVRRFTFTW